MGRIDTDALREQFSVSDVLCLLHAPTGDGSLTNCPFCYAEQATPKATFSYTDRLWYCFRCQRGGDIFSLIQRSMGLSFIESAQVLGGRRPTVTGVPGKEEPPRWLWLDGRDEQRERADFNHLDTAIRHERDARIARASAKRKAGYWGDEEEEWEIGVARATAELLWSELDRIRNELLYWLRRLIRRPPRTKGGV